MVCPDKVRPDASVIVPETSTGKDCPNSAKTFSTANAAALALSHDNPRDFIDGMLINIDRLVEELNNHIIRLKFEGILMKF